MALAKFDRDCDFLSVANERERDGVAGPGAVQEETKIHLTGERLVVPRDKDVAAGAEFLQTGEHRAITGANTSLRSGASGRDTFNEDSLLHR